MILGWVFGMFFGMIVGVGGKNEIDYHKCLKDTDKAKCEQLYHDKK